MRTAENTRDVIVEGKAKILYSEEFIKNLSSKIPIFYNPNMRINRDFSIAIIKSLSKILERKLDILDAMAATGIRGIRILLEAGEFVNEIVFTDTKKESIENIKENLKLNEINSNNVYIINSDCRKVMLDRKFDYIDIDPFGSPIGFIQPTIISLRNNGVIGVTATDISSLSGSKQKACYRKYSCIGIKTDFYLEFGIRNLARYVIEEGLKFDKALIPIFGYYYLHHYRIFFIKSKKRKDIDKVMEYIKHIYYCPKCHYKSIEKDECPNCNLRMKLLGPIYIGPLWEDKIMEYLKENITSMHTETIKTFEKIYNWDYKCKDIWYYYDIHKVSKYLKISKIPKLGDLIKHGGCRTHFTPTGIKIKEYPKIH